jgi:hypothetical protein
MPRKVLPRIVAVAPGERPMILHVRWDKGDESLIDVSGIIQSFRVYAPLPQSPELFRQVRVGEHGTEVVWTDEIDMAVGGGGLHARPQPAHGSGITRRASPDTACRRVGDPSAGYDRQ